MQEGGEGGGREDRCKSEERSGGREDRCKSEERSGGSTGKYF